MTAKTQVASVVQMVALDALDRPRENGARLRAYCHLHGGDHQRSLSIATDGDEAGYGYCHSCRAVVFVPELNPQEAARRSRGQGRDYRAPGQSVRPITGADLLRPPRRSPSPASVRTATPADWQRDELAALTRLDERMRARLRDDKPRAYLDERKIPLEIAQALGVGYIPADARLIGDLHVLAKWRDRIIFPLGSPDGSGYAGRSLWGWQPGMDEGAHKTLLDSTPDAPRRWEKTYPAGWFNFAALAADHAPRVVVMVEGPFDLLALVAACIPDGQIVATVGTAARVAWLPASCAVLVLAYDGDAGGQSAIQLLAQEAASPQVGLRVVLCAPDASDGYGKDWSERWRRAGWDGVLAPADALLDLELGQ